MLVSRVASQICLSDVGRCPTALPVQSADLFIKRTALLAQAQVHPGIILRRNISMMQPPRPIPPPPRQSALCHWPSKIFTGLLFHFQLPPKTQKTVKAVPSFKPSFRYGFSCSHTACNNNKSNFLKWCWIGSQNSYGARPDMINL